MILFVTQNTDSFNNPTIDAFLTVLEEKKQYSILLCSASKFKNKFKYCKVVFYKERRLNFSEGKKKLILKIVKNIIQFLNLLLLKFDVKTIIAIDPDGLILSRKLKKKLFIKAPIDYLSFEILESSLYKNKKKEIAASNEIRNLIIQDSLRETFIRSENKISSSVNTFHIPVSPIFKDNYKNEIENFRKVHFISEEKKMIINFGSFDKWSGAHFIYEILISNCLPDDYVFVIHSRYPLNTNSIIHKKITEYSKNNKNLVLSNTYIESFDDSLLFLRQFDFGTAFYFPDDGLYTGNNIYNIGLASGKFSMYMKAQLPTFTTNLPFYKSLNEKYDYGYLINDLEDFKRQINECANSSKHKSNNCKILYDDKLESKSKIITYLNRILN